MTLQWIGEPKPGRTLFLVFAYHGRDRDRPGPSLLERIEDPGAHGHRIVHRDHYANPRTFAYQMAMLNAAAAALAPSDPPDVVIDAALQAGIPGADVVDLAQPRWWRHTLPTRAREYQNVVLIYADALGLGCEEAERRLVRECGAVLVINGRRRVFRVDGDMSRRLDRHRWLASTRAVERMMAVLVRPFAAGLAAYDRLTGRAA